MNNNARLAVALLLELLGGVIMLTSHKDPYAAGFGSGFFFCGIAFYVGTILGRIYHAEFGEQV